MILLLCSIARADDSDAIARARTHFEAGRALYKLGNYNDAIREFSAGYQLVPKPQFLVNLGQAYRKLGRYGEARDMYRRFLRETDPNDPERRQVKQILDELEAKLAAEPPRPRPAPEKEPPPATPPPLAAAAPAPAPAPAAAVQVTAVAPAPRKSWARRNWWVFPVGGAVVITAVVLGVYFGTRPAGVDCSAATLGCVNPTAP